ncbi:hypothetical protein [Soonwooa sp.]|uniref:hypothetical protein n=1 Tax=Soonwooa sp. TaxID=1938592 RepID=UPI0026112FC2|nr:hypothetical protein [Soonwooa sp.]
MKNLFMAISIALFSINAYAQDTQRVFGDLNKDGIDDLVEVKSIDNGDNAISYNLKIYFLDAKKNKKLIISTDKAIEEHTNGDGESFDNAVIKNGALQLNYSFIRGGSTHIFRYQNGAFELIGFKYGNSDGNGHMTNIDFNLSTGHYIYKSSNYETDKVLSKTDKIIKIKPLPNLATFEPYVSKYGY